MKKSVAVFTAVAAGVVLAPLTSVFAAETVLTIEMPETSAYELLIPATQEIAPFAPSTEIGSVGVLLTSMEGVPFPENGVRVSVSHTAFTTADGKSALNFVLGDTETATSNWTGDVWTQQDVAGPKEVKNFVNISHAEWDRAVSDSYTATITYTATAID